MNLLIKNKQPDPFSVYYDILEDALYGGLLAKAEAVNQKVALVNCLNDPKKIRRQTSPDLLNFFETQFGSTSLMTIAKWLKRLAEIPSNPRSVLTFNADGLLDTISKLLDIQQYIIERKPQTPPDRLFRALRASDPPPTGSDSSARRIPIFHLHGCLTPQLPAQTQARGRESRENLVFPETTYGRISGKVFTWQQTVFLSHAQAHRIVFIGLSMSDQNIRRWLAWCNENAVEEHKLRSRKYSKPGAQTAVLAGSDDYFIGQNIWIEERPKSDRLADAMEFALAHLGTRICWLQSWNELAVALNNLSAL
ncbi:MAG: SIR2 family protein [Verrucomicrobiota bacterium]|jgi:hypothetical protein